MIDEEKRAAEIIDNMLDSEIEVTSVEKQLFGCPFCGKSLGESMMLNEIGEKEYFKCYYCNKLFTYKSAKQINVEVPAAKCLTCTEYTSLTDNHSIGSYTDNIEIYTCHNFDCNTSGKIPIALKLSDSFDFHALGNPGEKPFIAPSTVLQEDFDVSMFDEPIRHVSGSKYRKLQAYLLSIVASETTSLRTFNPKFFNDNIYYKDGLAVGYLSWNTTDVNDREDVPALRGIWVMPQYRREKVGSSLLTEFIDSEVDDFFVVESASNVLLEILEEKSLVEETDQGFTSKNLDNDVDVGFISGM